MACSRGWYTIALWYPRRITVYTAVDFWQIDNCLKPNVLRGIQVGILRMPAAATDKVRLVFAILLVAAAADRAGARRVPGIHQDYRNTTLSGFVGDEGAQLVERPGGTRAPAGFLNPYLVEEVLEIFQSDAATSA